MRGLLHVLWDRAELTHWHPKMAGKRSWFVVRRALLPEGRPGEEAKSAALASYLLFDGAFTRELMALGRADTLARRGEVVRFFGWGDERR